jgi:hypothetical protein
MLPNSWCKVGTSKVVAHSMNSPDSWGQNVMQLSLDTEQKELAASGYDVLFLQELFLTCDSLPCCSM